MSDVSDANMIHLNMQGRRWGFLVSKVNFNLPDFNLLLLLEQEWWLTGSLMSVKDLLESGEEIALRS